MAIPYRKAPLAVAVSAALFAVPSHLPAITTTPGGNEFEVPQDTGNTLQEQPDVASDDNGNFVVVWDTGNDIVGQRFGSLGGRRGGEFTVNSDGAADNRREPRVALDSDGDFVVSWFEYAAAGGYYDVVYRVFQADGTPVTADQNAAVSVERATNLGSGKSIDVAIDQDGDFVVSWIAYDRNIAVPDDVPFFSTFLSNGNPISGTTRASTDPAGNNVSVDMADNGNFVVTWMNFNQAPDNGGGNTDNGVFARRFDVTGGALDANEFLVNTTILGSQRWPDVAVKDDGDFVIAWHAESGQIDFQQFAADGTRVGGETQANVADPFTFPFPQVGIADGGDFAIAWEGADGGEDGIFARAFAADGSPQSGDLAISQGPAPQQQEAEVAVDSDGDFVVVWEENYDDVFARRFGPSAEQFIEGTGGGPGSLGWLAALSLGLGALGRRLFSRKRKNRGGVAGLLAGVLALGAMGGSPSGQAATPPEAGSVEEVSGDVTAVRTGESARSLAYGDPVYTGDRVRTGEGARAVLRLSDGTRVSLTQNSEFRVAEVRRRQNEDGGTTLSGMFMDLLQGGLRMITGSVANRDPESYQLRTPVATIGVRGTEFEARLCARGACPEEAGAAADGPDPVARVLRIEGVARAEGPNDATRVLEKGASVFRDDTVTTADDAWVVLRFADRSKVSLQPGTAFRVDEWEFDSTDPDESSALLNLLRGGMRVLTGLIGSEATENYQVQTPVATIGVRGTGFDLLCVGGCVDSSVQALGQLQGDGLLVHSWDGEMFFQLDGRIAEFQAGQTGFLANASANPLRLPQIPSMMQQLPAPRPDAISGALPEGGERLYTRVEDGAITVQGAQGAPLVVGAGESALVSAGGAAQPIAGAPGILGEGLGVPAISLAGALGELWLAQFDLGTWYAGGTTGTTLSGSKSDFENRLQDDFADASVESLDGGLGGRVFGGFRLLGLVGVEVGYAELGDIESEIDPGSNSDSQVAEAALDVHPFAPSGIDVSAIVATTVDPTGTTRAFARTGMFFWEGEINTVTPSGERFSKDVSGSDPLVGGGVEYRIGPNMHARAEWIHYLLDPDPVNYVGAGVVWTLP